MANLPVSEDATALRGSIPSLNRDVIVVGGSSGALLPLMTMLSQFPAGVRAAVLAALHRPREGRFSVELLSRRSMLPVSDAIDDSPLRPGRVLLAPADRHLLIEDDQVRVVRGPRENGARPSVDVLFRSAAVEFGPRVIAVLLSGMLSDGIAGLDAVRRCGGSTIVQDPDDASFGELPANAMRANVVDHVAKAADLVEIVLALFAKAPPEPVPIPEELRTEARHASLHMANTGEVATLGEAAPLTCPECGGPIWSMGGKGDDARFRCEVGHAFTMETFLEEQGRSLERALWIAYRTLKERSSLVKGMAETAESRGHGRSAEHYRKAVDDLEEHADAVKAVLKAGD